jgi:hypothetical protein
VPPEKAKQIIEAFQVAYAKLGKPNLLIYVNRELVDEKGGLQPTERREHTVTVEGGRTTTHAADPKAPPAAPPTGSGQSTSENHRTTVSADNTYVAVPRPPPSLADRQMVRDVERLFGRPLRAGGARLADQRVAEEILADKPIGDFVAPANDAARRDRAALAQVADVVIEVLISSHDLAVPTLAGPNRIDAVPDIQATAIRLKDAVILGQVAASDVLGKKWQAARLASQFDVNDIAEATALSLMEDITLNGSH